MVGLQRLRKLLDLPDRAARFPVPADPAVALGLRDVYAAWPVVGSDGTLPDDDRRALKGVSMVIKAGSLVGVCGAVGAGKSSLLALLLGQMEVMSGGVECTTDIAYVAQQAWILSDTLRNNILFGEVTH